MVLAVVALGVAALAYGASAVLQAAAVARTSRADLTGLVTGLARDPRYLGGFALTAAGFLLSMVAVRALPLFAVQAGRASSLAVTAALAAAVLGTRLRRHELTALAGVALGLVAVAVSASPEGPAPVTDDVRWAALAGALVLTAVTLGLVRAEDSPRAGVSCAVVAGLCFGLLSLSARALGPVTLPGLLVDPSAYALALSGAAGLLAGALALRQGQVVVVTATLVATESVSGALWGVLVGDHTAPGMGTVATTGFLLTVGSALVLARFGTVEAAPTTAPAPALV